MRDWWLDEQRTVGSEHLDPSYVAGYDTKAQFDPTGEIQALVALGLDDSSTVVDLGAGTGAFTVAAAPIASSVIAVEPSPVMVEALRRRVAEHQLTNVEVTQAGFLSHDRPPESVDVVFSRNALHQLPDWWKVLALRRMADVLRPGGWLRLLDLVFDVAPDEIEATVDAWMGRAVDDAKRGYTSAEFAEHLRSEFSTYTWLLEPMLERVGFEVVARDVRASVYATYTCRRP